MIRFCLLGSGSKGNALLVESGHTKILIDNGLSLKMASARAAKAGTSLEGLAAAFVTHEHNDHVGGIGVLARRYDIPIYMTQGTFERLPKTVGAIPNLQCFEAGSELSVDGMRLTSYSISHDAADPVSYIVQAGHTRLGIATDLGWASNLVRTRLSGSHGLVLESNHCPEMLRKGPYPYELQQRILSRHGHLSNADMNALLNDLLHETLQVIVLAHISQENNTGDLAHRLALRTTGSHPAQILVAKQDEPTPILEIRG